MGVDLKNVKLFKKKFDAKNRFDVRGFKNKNIFMLQIFCERWTLGPPN